MCDKIKSFKTKKATFIATLVKVSRTILVKHIKDADEELIQLYFESKRSGGGRVEKVRLIDDDKAEVTFADHKGK